MNCMLAVMKNQAQVCTQISNSVQELFKDLLALVGTAMNLTEYFTLKDRAPK